MLMVTHRLDQCEHPTAAARHLTADALQSWTMPAALIDDATLVVSELVANASVHAARGRIDLAVAVISSGTVLICVRDTDPDRLPVQSTTPNGESGRGLAIVEALSTAHGCRSSATGKIAWAMISSAEELMPLPRSVGPSPVKVDTRFVVTRRA